MIFVAISSWRSSTQVQPQVDGYEARRADLPDVMGAKARRSGTMASATHCAFPWGCQVEVLLGRPAHHVGQTTLEAIPES
jgi:hypothetical protein